MKNQSVDQRKISYNLQDNNVGNIGDIIKHAALLELARLIKSCNATSAVHYIDTHAYKFIAKLSNLYWRENVDDLLQDYPAYQFYYQLQMPYVDKNKYKCSSAIVSEIMPSLLLHISEHDFATRQILETQLRDYGIKPATLLCDVRQWCSTQPHEEKGPLLMLVDPFKLSGDCWQGALCALSNLHLEGEDGAVLVFTYNKENNVIDWPLPPPNWKGPLATIERKPYFLAVYATESIETEAHNCLSNLGWRTQS